MDNQKSKLDKFFSNPAAAVAMAILCNILWGSARPFIKMGYRMFAIDSSDTATILCFAGVRFMMGAALVWLAGLALNHRPLPMPRGKQLAVCCGLGLWQTAAQYFFYYSAAALLTTPATAVLRPQGGSKPTSSPSAASKGRFQTPLFTSKARLAEASE